MGSMRTMHLLLGGGGPEYGDRKNVNFQWQISAYKDDQ